METSLHNLLGLSVMIPGDPSVSGFKLLEETFESLTSHHWFGSCVTQCRSDKAKMCKLRVMLNFVGCIATLLQNKLPYHAPKVDANDSIFINDEIYISGGKSLIQRAVQEICGLMNEVDKTPEGEEVKHSNVMRLVNI